MAGTFTRSALRGFIKGDDAEETINNVMALYGRALENDYVSKVVAEEDKKAAIALAVEDAKKNAPQVNIKESDEYKALEHDFSAYKEMQNARTAEDYKDVKPKFFETVYGMIDRKEDAKPVAEQLSAIKTKFEEYFTPDDPGKEDPKPGKPQFGDDTGGGMPGGEKGNSMLDAWGYTKKYGLDQKGK